MGVFSRFNNYLDKVVTWVGIVLFAVMVAAAGAQIVARYVLHASLDWSEELVRYMFVWSVLLGSSMCVKRRGHVGVELVVRMLPERLYGWAMIFADILSGIFFAILVVYGLEITGITAEQYSPALEIPMSFAYASIPVSGFVMILYTLENILTDIRKLLAPAKAANPAAAHGGK